MKKINDQLVGIWKIKLAIENEIKHKKGNSDINYALNKDLELLGLNKLYISSFLNKLWLCPEVMCNILLNTETEKVQTNLAPFICNNIYCNYLSGNYMENNLLYIISIMLKNEIDQLESVEQFDTFLENTKCGFLLEELRKMPDIQIFFKNVIFNTIESIERTYSYKDIKFKVEEIYEDLMKYKNEEEKKLGKKHDNQNDIFTIIINSKVIDLSINYSREENKKKTNQKYDYFIKEYVPDFSLKEIKEREENAKKENNQYLYEFLNQLENDIISNDTKELYANTVIMKKMFDSKLPMYLFSFYLNDFLEVIKFITLLLEDLMKNLFLLPSSIKCICKIISSLIKKKFPNITKTQENSFISKFIIGKLLIPIMSSPSINSLINDFVISENSLKNIKVFTFVLQRLFSGKLFLDNPDEGDYTPFNRFFVSNIDKIYNFYEKIKIVDLPDFLEKYVDGKLDGDFSYDYFKENEGQLCANISICFNLNNLITLLEGIDKDKNLFDTNNPIINKLEKSFIRLKEEYIEKEKNKEKENNNEKNNKKSKKENLKKKDTNTNTLDKNSQYFIYNEYVYEDKYKHLFTINNKFPNFYIDLKKLKNQNLDEKEKNVIKVKNYLCSSIGNYRLLNKSDFSTESINDTIKMLNEIKNYMSLPNFILNNNNIPSIWYINSIIDHLNKLPEDYKKNDYKQLFVELKCNLNESINNLDFEKLILFKNKVKFLDKMKNYYENVKQLIDDILMNENIKHIVEDIFIPIDLNFRYDKETKKFELNKSNLKEKSFEGNIKYEEPKKCYQAFKTIEAFTRYFPNLVKYQTKQGINPIKIIKDLSINEKIQKYLDIIEEKISKKEIVDRSQNILKYKEKINDYIMNKIYEKIYPLEPDEMDQQFYKQAIQLSWVEPNLFLNKDYIFDNILPDILNEFQQINNNKTPYQKLKSMKKIFNYIAKLIIFNEGEDKEVGADDITPVLNYVLIKAHPFRISTDIEFTKTFLEKFGENENELVNLYNMSNAILKTTAETFNLSEEEYNKRCIESTN